MLKRAFAYVDTTILANILEAVSEGGLVLTHLGVDIPIKLTEVISLQTSYSKQGACMQH